MDKRPLIQQLNKINQLARAGKWSRLAFNPLKYISAISFKDFLYKFTKKEIIVSAPTFFNTILKVALPSSTDIYLMGAKSHYSEIKLALYLINNLKPNDHFLDIGAHCGYFTLLGHTLLNETGKVLAIEPTSKSMELLKMNTIHKSNIEIKQIALSNNDDGLTFYEFPNLYTEYNSFDISRHEHEDWFKNNQPEKVFIATNTITQLMTPQFQATVIKIDVEGAENIVIQGGMSYFKQHHPIIIMEYLEDSGGNSPHQQAAEQLFSIGYKMNIITQEGNLAPVNNIHEFLKNEGSDSDNVVFTINS